MEATDSGREEVLKLLIKYNAHIDSQDDNGRTALIYAVYTGVPGRENGKPGKETKELAYNLLEVGADYTI